MSPLDVLALERAPGATAAEDACGLVTALHDCVPGRVRWRVIGLHRDPDMKALLEAGLPELPGMVSVRASIETGGLLTLFDPALPAWRVRQRIGALIRGEVVPPPGAEPPDWHARHPDEVATALRTSIKTGLGLVEAGVRLAEHGANALPPAPGRSAFGILVGQFQSLPVGLLVLAGGFSIVSGAVLEAVAILGVVAVNGVLGAALESRGERTIRSLGEGAPEPPSVVRGGETLHVSAAALVPGDLLVLRQGMVVPADARLVASRNLRVSEAMLTGESLPVLKAAEAVGPSAPLAARASMVYCGTAVTGGSGSAIVVATGRGTEMGRIQRLLGESDTPATPLQLELNRLGRQLVWASLAACAGVMGVGLLRGLMLMQVIRLGISLAVAAIPEGLPTVATTTLALGIEDMRRRGVLVRRLDAVETLASVRVVCFDKTGTLTLNQMRVVQVLCGARHDASEVVSLAAADPALWALLRAGVLCSDAEVDGEDGSAGGGSATERALLQLALEAGMNVREERLRRPCVAVRHRSGGYRFMATAHREPRQAERVLLAVKGSPMEVLELCSTEMQEGGVTRPLTDARRDEILGTNSAMAADALRVLGVATAEAPIEALDDGLKSGGLTWLGLAGITDPVRPGLDPLMRTLHGAGLRTVMMTGDQVETARAVAERLGLASSGAVDVFDGSTMDSLDAEALAAAARRADVFARVTPTQKLTVIRMLQAAGSRVAMVGDGINDSPALKAADVGISMGGGASSTAAREAADVVLQTDDLASLSSAVERGRATYVNVRKSIRYLLGTNLSEILVVLAATASGFGEPLTALQLLWINLVSDVLPGVGLAFEPPEPELMQRPPPKENALLDRRELVRLGADGATLAAGSLGALGYGLLRHGPGPEARTMAFGALITTQLMHALSCRSEGRGTLPPNRPLSGLLLGSVALQAVGLLLPQVRAALGVAPIGPMDLLATGLGGVLPYVLNEARKPALAMADGDATGSAAPTTALALA